MNMSHLSVIPAYAGIHARATLVNHGMRRNHKGSGDLRRDSERLT